MPVQPEKRSGDPQVRIAAKEHPVVSLSAGRITVEASVVRAGADLCIVLTGGIHVDDIRPDEIKTVLHLVDRLTTALVDLLTAERKTP